MDARFNHTKYHIRKKVIALAGAKLHIFDANQNVIMFSQLKAFKLKEDIAIYTDENKTQELIKIKARNYIDFSATYDVIDSQSGETIGALKRKGMKSIFKDEWIILDNNDNERGLIKEDSRFKAFLRRFLSSLIPQTYFTFIGQQQVATYKRNINPFVSKLDLDLSADATLQFDRRLAMAAAILLCAVEGKQDA
jgi:hypothetical protein